MAEAGLLSEATMAEVSNKRRSRFRVELLLCIKVVKKSSGEVAEWSKAAVLKTVECNSSGGSNPSFSAIYQRSIPDT